MSLAQLRVSYWVNFFIKKNVNSTKDYGFENSNDKWFFCNLQWIKLSGNVLETD